MAAPTNYDALRRDRTVDTADASFDMPPPRRPDARLAIIDGEIDPDEPVDLPGADLSDVSIADELTMPVVPLQDTEFVCFRCFLVHHRSGLTRDSNDQPICLDCT